MSDNQKNNESCEPPFASTGNKEPLEELVKFPSDYDFKIMGKTELIDIEVIIRQIESIVKRSLPAEGIRKRESSKKKYISYSVKVYLDEYEQLKKIYEILKSNKSVIYYL